MIRIVRPCFTTSLTLSVNVCICLICAMNSGQVASAANTQPSAEIKPSEPAEGGITKEGPKVTPPKNGKAKPVIHPSDPNAPKAAVPPQQPKPKQASTAKGKAGAGAEKKTEKEVLTWDIINRIYNNSSNTTQMQKKEYWKSLEGMTVTWTGTVESVSKGYFSGITLQVKMNRDTMTADVVVSLKPNQEAKALRLTKGSRVKYSGVLADWGSLLYYVSLKDGEILQ